MARPAALLIWLALALPVPAFAQSPCPASNSTPQFTAGGSVFGRFAAQWNAYLGAKVDVNNGTLCNPTIYPAPLFVVRGYTVATLPAAQVGTFAYVTDQMTACVAAGAALAGGGSLTCPVFYNGSAWVGG